MFGRRKLAQKTDVLRSDAGVELAEYAVLVRRHLPGTPVDGAESGMPAVWVGVPRIRLKRAVKEFWVGDDLGIYEQSQSEPTVAHPDTSAGIGPRVALMFVVYLEHQRRVGPCWRWWEVIAIFQRVGNQPHGNLLLIAQANGGFGRLPGLLNGWKQQRNQ